MKFIIANWKSNKTIAQARDWLGQITNTSNKKIIVCPSFTALSQVKLLITNYQLPIKLGAQDISQYEKGEYTGAVNGQQLKELVDYVIVGHSERRQYFGDNGEVLIRKVDMAKKYNLTPIFCIQNKEADIPEGVKIVAYEPTIAIGTGFPDTPEDADGIASEIKKGRDLVVLYGGSVTSLNVKNFTKMPNLDGVLVGGASLDAEEFAKIIINA